MDPARRKQFRHLGEARDRLLVWAGNNDVPLVRVEFVVPFVESDFDVAVWLFYDSAANVARCAASGTTDEAEHQLLSILADDGYPADWLAGTSFYVDSHENVERNFEGSYFYRLR
jgi:hypothetical protein